MVPSRHQVTSACGLEVPVSQSMSSWVLATGCLGVSLMDTLLGGTVESERTNQYLEPLLSLVEERESLEENPRVLALSLNRKLTVNIQTDHSLDH